MKRPIRIGNGQIIVSGNFENKQFPISIEINCNKPQCFTLLAAKELRDKLDECLSWYSSELSDSDIEAQFNPESVQNKCIKESEKMLDDWTYKTMAQDAIKSALNDESESVK